MEINQKLIVARDALYEKDYTTLAKLVVENQVGGDSVVSEYILQHENGLFLLQDKFWLQFEKEIIELENLEVTMSDFHREFALQYIQYGADIIDNNPELSWRLWLCLWVAGIKKVNHAGNALAFIAQSNGVDVVLSYDDHVVQYRLTAERRAHIQFLYSYSKDYKNVVSGDGEWYGNNCERMRHPFRRTINDRLPTLIGRVPTITVQTCVQMLQQVCLRPPDRVMQLLNMPRFTSPIGTEV